MSCTIFRSAGELRAACDQARDRDERIGLVPTMGALHEGHLRLVREAQRRAQFVVVSIFVNPTQFGPGEDFARYPRDLQGDLRSLAQLGKIAVFAPEREELYDAQEQTRVRVSRLGDILCGRFRPGHFEGVATIVAKLFGLVGPCDAVFGRKDYQQWLVIRRMTSDLMMPVQVIGHPTLREADGLAMSSRNRYLTPEERGRATAVARGLTEAVRAFAAGERNARVIERLAREPIDAVAARVDYLETRDADTLDPIDGDLPERAALLIACHIGATRLIDNVVLGEDAAPIEK